ncbi:GTP-binding protein rho3 [Choanephora cucurbitarum]|uniref:GTP-binding protein rho3 n=1 Tax=Choanephora cucurbitarum TaxID=101091 RepID=A0A1C7N4R4_9FUNG|nr:GTP-binding protein rho3 [Choanephora cucurbitarum]
MVACRIKKKALKRKIVVVGDGACGKTSLLNVYIKACFPEIYEPTVFENYVQTVNVDEQDVYLSLWDTAGQEEFDRIRSLSYEGAHVVVICYSVENRDSLENIPNRWIEEIQESTPYAKVILVALKCDLRYDEVVLKKMKPIVYEEGLEVAKKIRAIRYLECSAKLNRGVRECFEEVAKIAASVKLHDSQDSSPCIIL